MAKKAVFSVWLDLGAATSLLTRLPLSIDHAAAGARGARAAWAYPIIGAAIGGVGGGVYLGCAAFGAPPSVCVAAALGAMAIATGGLHEDGLADFCDGVGGGRDRAHALEIMKDPRVGAFGVVALMIGILARYGALESMSPVSAILALICAGAFSRGLLPISMLWAPDAREGGLSASVGAPPKLTAVLALALGLAPFALFGTWFGWSALFAVLFGGLGVLWVLRLAVQKLGGRTGDVLGAAQQAAEIGVLTALSLNL